MKLFLPEEHEPGAGIRAGALPLPFPPAAPPPADTQDSNLALSASASPGQLHSGDA